MTIYTKLRDFKVIRSVNVHLKLVLFCSCVLVFVLVFSDVRLFFILPWTRVFSCFSHFVLIVDQTLLKLSSQAWHKRCAMTGSPRISRQTPWWNFKSIWERCYPVLRDIWMIHGWLSLQRLLVIGKYQISDFACAMPFAVSCDRFSPGEQDL